MNILARDYYIKLLNYFDDKYAETLKKINIFVAELDVIKSNSKCAKMYGYCRPEIKQLDTENSYIDAKDLRHPIIERLDISTNYIPNDIKLDDDETGILLYGLNAVGKSSLMKSVGLDIIMAQMGGYVPASQFVYYPYCQIFTRLTGNDNMYHGQSSYTIEMTELNSIFKYSNPNSLVIGDEICRGTETISALSIVSASIYKLAKDNVSFIFATHLHQLSDISVVTDLANVGLYHLEVFNDGKKLIYNRKKKSGPGSSIYGIEVAEFIIEDKDVIKMAYKVRDQLLQTPEYILNPKSGKYNSNIYVHACQICKKTYKETQLDEHHIIFQSECNENGLKNHVQKNTKSNFAVLCKEHHIAVHNKDLEIYGYLDTSEGVILDYKFLDKAELVEKKKSRLKYGQEEIDVIMKYKNKPNSYIIEMLKEKHNIIIGKSTLNKILKGNYLS